MEKTGDVERQSHDLGKKEKKKACKMRRERERENHTSAAADLAPAKCFVCVA